MAAARYWGLSQQDYYKKADVWGVHPAGEILVILMIEDVVGINNLEAILEQVPGIGVLLFGEGDLSQELGVPRQYQHPEVLRHLQHVLEVGKAHNVAVGHPHVDASNVADIIQQGFRFLMTFPRRDFGAVEMGLKLSGRK